MFLRRKLQGLQATITKLKMINYNQANQKDRILNNKFLLRAQKRTTMAVN